MSCLRQALARFGNLLALGLGPPAEQRPADVGLALIARSGAGVQLQVVYKPSPFVFRDFQASVVRLRDHEAWAQPDTRKLVLALKSLVQHLAAAAATAAARGDPTLEHPAAPPPGVGRVVVVVVAHCFTQPAGGLLGRVLEEAAQAMISVNFLTFNTEQSLAVFRNAAGAPSPGGGQSSGTVRGAAGGGDGGDGLVWDAAPLAAAAAAAAAAFGAAVSPHENADHASVLAEAGALERLYTGWAQQLLQPLAAPEVLLVLPGGGGGDGPGSEADGPGTGAGGHDDGEGGGTSKAKPERVFRCTMRSQVSYLEPRCRPCPLCICHGLPTLPLARQGPGPSYCRAHPGLLLPPDAAPPDPLTVRLGAAQELRLSGRSGAPQCLVGEPSSIEAGGTTGQGFPATSPVRLVAERIVRPSEVDESIVYGWPQVLMPSYELDEQDFAAEVSDGSGGGDEGARATESLAALVQVLRDQDGAALLASARAALCDGPAGRPPPAPTSLRQWYLLLPGPGCFLMRQLACREQLVPLQPPAADAPATTPAALKAAQHALELLPGWGVGGAGAGGGGGGANSDGGNREGPVAAAVAPIAVAPAAVAPAGPGESSPGAAPAIEAIAAAAAAMATAVRFGYDNGDVGVGGCGTNGSGGEGVVRDAEAADSTAAAVAGQAGGHNDSGAGVRHPPGTTSAAAPRDAAGDGALAATPGAEEPAAAAATTPPPPSFSPLLLTSGCHELLASLLRDSVRLTPRTVMQQVEPAAAGAAAHSADAAAGAAAELPPEGLARRDDGVAVDAAAASPEEAAAAADSRQQPQQRPPPPPQQQPSGTLVGPRGAPQAPQLQQQWGSRDVRQQAQQHAHGGPAVAESAGGGAAAGAAGQTPATAQAPAAAAAPARQLHRATSGQLQQHSTTGLRPAARPSRSGSAPAHLQHPTPQQPQQQQQQQPQHQQAQSGARRTSLRLAPSNRG